MKRVVVVDYGAGNVRSVANALKRLQPSVEVSSDPLQIGLADALVLPGVGSFQGFMSALKEKRLDTVVASHAKADRQLLGICVGMQALAQFGTEMGVTEGLGLVIGQVLHLEAVGVRGQRIPHVGWGSIRLAKETNPNSALQVLEGRDVYFMHSYCWNSTNPNISAWTDYGVPICAAIEHSNILGVQFHPEKSQFAGLDFLEAWLERVKSE